MKKELSNYGLLLILGLFLLSLASCKDDDDDPNPDPGTELTITSFSPEEGAPEDTVIITGTGFSATGSQNQVYFNDFNTRAAVISAAATGLSVRVPDGVVTGPIIVIVGEDTATSTTDFVLFVDTTPVLESLSVVSGRPGDVVEIEGTNFTSSLADVMVYFGETAATEVISATTTSIAVKVPVLEEYTEELVSVSVEISGVTSSNTLEFTIVRPLQQLASVYWGSNEGFINRTDSTGTTTIYDADGVPLYGIALDDSYENIYYINGGDLTVNVGSVSGFVEASMLYSSEDGLQFPYDIAIDESQNALYIVDLYASQIFRGSLDGTEALTSVYDVTSDGGSYPSSVKLYIEGDALYWTEANFGGQRIMRGSLDGTATAEEVISTDVAEQGYQGLAVDPEAGLLYYAEVTGYSPPICRIFVTAISGEGSPTLLFDEEDGVSGNVNDLEIDLENGYLYWMNQENDGELMRGLLDGSGETDVIFEGISEGSFFDLEFGL